MGTYAYAHVVHNTNTPEILVTEASSVQDALAKIYQSITGDWIAPETSSSRIIELLRREGHSISTPVTVESLLITQSSDAVKSTEMKPKIDTTNLFADINRKPMSFYDIVYKLDYDTPGYDPLTVSHLKETAADLLLHFKKYPAQITVSSEEILEQHHPRIASSLRLTDESRAILNEMCRLDMSEYRLADENPYTYAERIRHLGFNSAYMVITNLWQVEQFVPMPIYILAAHCFMSSMIGYEFLHGHPDVKRAISYMKQHS